VEVLWLIAIGEVIGYLAITLGYANTTYTSIVAILSELLHCRPFYLLVFLKGENDHDPNDQ